MARRTASSARQRIAARGVAIALTVPMGLAAGAQMLPSLLLAAQAPALRPFGRREANVELEPA